MLRPALRLRCDRHTEEKAQSDSGGTMNAHCRQSRHNSILGRSGNEGAPGPSHSGTGDARDPTRNPPVMGGWADPRKRWQ
jgi:hypothetical protein